MWLSYNQRDIKRGKIEAEFIIISLYLKVLYTEVICVFYIENECLIYI
jgi:hypothetical protein